MSFAFLRAAALACSLALVSPLAVAQSLDDLIGQYEAFNRDGDPDEAAKARGEGATVYKGRLVDIASIKQAEVIVRQSEMIAATD